MTQGATRLELCSNLFEGGTSPSIGLLQVVKRVTQIPVYVMVRPRGGDFLYTEREMEVMRCDVTAFKQHGADGIVFGAVTSAGAVDVETCQELIDVARPLPITFHRAIDMTADIYEALDAVMGLGFERVLTSGGEGTALEGTPVIRRLVVQAGDRIMVMPGGGINEKNVRRIMDETGAREFHASARGDRESRMDHRNTAVKMGTSFGPPEFLMRVTDRDRVKSMVRASREAV